MGKRSRDAVGETFPEGSSKKRKREDKYGKEKKKRLREQKKDLVGLPEEDGEHVQVDAAENGEGEVLSKKALKKKSRKLDKERAKEIEAEGKENKGGAETPVEGAQAEPDDSKNKETEQGEDEAEEVSGGKKTRFIVFVGRFTSCALPPGPLLTPGVPRKPPLLRDDREHNSALRAAAPDLGAVPQQEGRPDQVPRVRLCGVLELQEHPDVPGQVAPFDV